MSLVGDTPVEVSLETVEIDTDTLLGIEEEVVVEAAPVVEEKVCTRKSRKGTQVIEEVMPCTN